MKKIISLFITAILIALSFPTTVYANEKSSDKRAHFNSVSGTVKEIRKSETEKDVTYLLLENDKGSEAYLILNKDTFFINDEEIYIGSQVTGYYDADAMMIMIYPPQYVALVVFVSNNEQNIKVDLFDSDLVSADNMLKLNISKDTRVELKDGKAFTGDLANRKLAVFYHASTRSIPAQTSPDKVVVLSDPIIPDKDNNSYFGSFKGTVTKMNSLKNDRNKTEITIKDEDGMEAIFIVSEDTYRTNDEKISVGSVVTGYYDAKVFRITIYPAQYEAVVLDVERPDYNIKVDYFDNKLTSADKSLTLKIGKDTEIICKDGKKYSGKPVKSNLVVIYDKSTKSIPAQTEPIKIIVLEDKNSKENNNKTDNKKDNKKAKEDKNSKEYWKKKLDEWMKLTDELIKNMDKLFEYKDIINNYIWKHISKGDFPLPGWLDMFSRD